MENNKLQIIPSKNLVARIDKQLTIENKILFGSIEKLFNQAFCLLNSKDLEHSKENFCLAFELNKNYRKERKFSYKANNIEDYHQSILLFSEVLKIKPKHILSFDFRGIAKSALKDYAAAIEDYSKAIEIDPNYATAYVCRGNAKYALKDYGGAIEDYSKAIEIDPNFADAYSYRAAAKDALKDYGGAVEDCSKAIEIDPNYAYAYCCRGLAKRELGNYEEAENDFKHYNNLR
ncbi:MAG: tetratricopeptide repeat protein [Dysgonamonadaceae bacterium]|nr:tetratricopeptide repeat protein [Dysgonamonadaceae bacterium]